MSITNFSHFSKQSRSVLALTFSVLAVNHFKFSINNWHCVMFWQEIALCTRLHSAMWTDDLIFSWTFSVDAFVHFESFSAVNCCISSCISCIISRKFYVQSTPTSSCTFECSSYRIFYFHQQFLRTWCFLCCSRPIACLFGRYKEPAYCNVPQWDCSIASTHFQKHRFVLKSLSSKISLFFMS